MELTAHRVLTITSLEYLIIEQKDPIIGKKKEELETLHSSTSKKKHKLKKDDSKVIPIKLPIKFKSTTSDI